MDETVLIEIQKTAYAFFRDHTNFTEDSKGYGLTLDHSKHDGRASIAATGFMLSSLMIGVRHGYLSQKEAYEKAYHTLLTLRDSIEHAFGFFPHYLNIHTGERWQKSEFSTIDTALCLCGVLAVDTFFKDAKIKEITKDIFERLQWKTLTHQYKGQSVLYMAYNPDNDGDYVLKKPGFIHQWDMFAEQLMIYVMIGGSSDHHLAKKLYDGFSKEKGRYKAFEYIYSPGNALFIYQLPHAWLDLKHVVDQEGFSWFENSKIATLAHQACAIDYQKTYRTFSKHFFGFTASDTPHGYRVYGGLPNTMNRLDTDGTIAPFGLIGSLIFTPDIILKSIKAMRTIQGLWGPYGFYDAFNFEGSNPWISDRYFAINKGIEMLMVNAFLFQDVQNAFMDHPIIKKGMEVLQWKKR